MFDNIGGKIKTLAVVVCVVGMIASLIFAIVLWSMDSYRTPTIALGFGVLIGGCVVSWVGSFFTYGFGELIEETTLNRQINQLILQQLSNAGAKENSSAAPVKEIPVAFADSTQRATRSSNVAPVRSSVPSGDWTCKMCGTRNRSTEISCRDCGAYK